MPGFSESVQAQALAAAAGAYPRPVPLTGERYYERRFRGEDLEFRRNDSYINPHLRITAERMQNLSRMWADMCERIGNEHHGSGIGRHTPFYIMTPEPGADTSRLFAFGRLPMRDRTKIMGMSERYLARLSDGEALAIMAHEMYHHLHPKDPNRKYSFAEQRQIEFDADAFAASYTGHPEWVQGGLYHGYGLRRDEFYADFGERYPSGRDEKGRNVQQSYQEAINDSRQPDTSHPLYEERMQRLQDMVDQQRREGRGPGR